QPTLATQAIEAAVTHLQFNGRLDSEQLQRIVDFARHVYAAQVVDNTGGDLMEPDGPPGFGVRNLANGREGLLGNNITNYVFPMGDKWKQLPPSNNPQDEARRSIVRGQDIFMFRTFWIKDAM